MEFRLHHIGYLVRDIAPSADDYCRRFGYRIESEIIEDPAQTACVQFLRLPGSDHWLELVAPNSPESKLANALKKGGGLNHLCYEVPDVESAVAHLRQDAMFPVGLPRPGVAFGGRRIAWMMDRANMLVELVESGPGPLCTAQIHLP